MSPRQGLGHRGAGAGMGVPGPRAHGQPRCKESLGCAARDPRFTTSSATYQLGNLIHSFDIYRAPYQVPGPVLSIGHTYHLLLCFILTTNLLGRWVLL